MPAVVDLAAMRDAIADLGGDPAQINPLIPAELVIDHSVQVDAFASRLAFARNVELEVERNRERYAFLRWGQARFGDFKVVPPGTGICPPGEPRVPGARRRDAATASPSPTRSSGTTRTRRWSTASACSAGASAGSRPRRRCSASRSRCSCRRSSASGCAGGCREGVDRDRPRAHRDRAAPPDRRRRQVRRVLRRRARGAHRRRPRDAREHVARVRRDLRLLPGRRADARLPAPDRPLRRRTSSSSRPTASENLLWHEPRRASRVLAGRRARPRRGRAVARRPAPARRTGCRSPGRRSRSSQALAELRRRARTRTARLAETFPASDPTTEQAPGGHGRARPGAGRRRPAAPTGGRARSRVTIDGEELELGHGAVVIAAITSCTNTSNPQVMVAAGLAREAGGRARAPARALGEDLARPGLAGRHRLLRARRPAALPRRARLQHRRLRLHDLHRQLRAAAAPRSRRRSPRATSSPAPCSRGTATSRRGSIPR